MDAGSICNSVSICNPALLSTTLEDGVDRVQKSFKKQKPAKQILLIIGIIVFLLLGVYLMNHPIV